MAETFTDPFTAVRLSPVRVAGKQVVSKLAVEVADDAGEWSVKAFVGREYQLMTNRLVFDLAEDIMSRAPAELGGFNHLKTLWNGKQFVAYFASRNPLTELRDRAGKLQMGLMAWNSYDGTRKVGFEIYALNAFCTNQYHSRNRFGFFAWRHHGADAASVDKEDALQSISTGIGNILALAPALETMRKESLLIEDVRSAKKGIGLPQSKWGDVLDRLAQEEGTRFGLFQALTYVASHQLGGLNAVGVGSEITEHFLAEKVQVINHTDAQSVLAGKA